MASYSLVPRPLPSSRVGSGDETSYIYGYSSYRRRARYSAKAWPTRDSSILIGYFKEAFRTSLMRAHDKRLAVFKLFHHHHQQGFKCVAMALKIKNDGAYLRDLDFDFLGFDEMELFQPTTPWLDKEIPGSNPPRRGPLSARDLKMNVHFTKNRISTYDLEPKLREFLKSFAPLISGLSSSSHKIQSMILKVSGDIVDMKGVLRSTHRKYNRVAAYMILFFLGVGISQMTLYVCVYASLPCVYSGTFLIRTPLGPSISGRIIEVSSFQGSLI